MPYGPTAFFGLANVVMRHDIPDAQPASEAFPHLVFDKMTTTIGERVRFVFAESVFLFLFACLLACFFVRLLMLSIACCLR